MGFLTKILGDGVGGKIADYFTKKVELKAQAALQKEQLESALHQKQLDNVAKAADYESAWNLAQANNSATSWKDELWTIVLVIPLVLAFIPGMAHFVLDGFKVLEQCPDWYRYFVGVAVSAAFGYQQANKVWTWWQKP